MMSGANRVIRSPSQTHPTSSLILRASSLALTLIEESYKRQRTVAFGASETFRKYAEDAANVGAQVEPELSLKQSGRLALRLDHRDGALILADNKIGENAPWDDELLERAVRNSSKTRDLGLDPFGGSGTTVIACEKSGRRARLIEMEPKYVDVIVKRWQEFAGAEAKRASDGMKFGATTVVVSAP